MVYADEHRNEEQMLFVDKRGQLWDSDDLAELESWQIEALDLQVAPI